MEKNTLATDRLGLYLNCKGTGAIGCTDVGSNPTDPIFLNRDPLKCGSEG